MNSPICFIWLCIWLSATDGSEYKELLRRSKVDNRDWSDDVYGSDEDAPAWPLPQPVDQAIETPDQTELVTGKKDDRWFNAFQGPNIYLGSNVQVGQQGQKKHHQASKSSESHGSKRHRQYVNQEECKCVYVIRQGYENESPPASTPTSVPAYTTSPKIYPAKRFVRNLAPTDMNREVEFGERDFGYGGHFGYRGNGSPGSRSDQSDAEEPHHLFKSHLGRQKYVNKPKPFVGRVDHQNNLGFGTRYRIMSGFRKPYTNVCVCPDQSWLMTSGSTNLESPTTKNIPTTPDFTTISTADVYRYGSTRYATGDTVTSSASSTVSTTSGKMTTTTPFVTSTSLASRRP